MFDTITQSNDRLVFNRFGFNNCFQITRKSITILSFPQATIYFCRKKFPNIDNLYGYDGYSLKWNFTQIARIYQIKQMCTLNSFKTQRRDAARQHPFRC